jgi:ferredoxin
MVHNTKCSKGINMRVKEFCMYCGECAGVCPHNLIEVRENSLKFNKEDCKDCKICIQVCPVKALENEVNS